jgi:hypothetical protein
MQGVGSLDRRLATQTLAGKQQDPTPPALHSPLQEIDLSPPGALKTLRVAEKHFDYALEQHFQAEKFQICPQCCPHLNRVCERSRLAISDRDQIGFGWLSVAPPY